MLALFDVGKMLGWGEYRVNLDGTADYEFFRIGAFSGQEDIEFVSYEGHFFPEVYEKGFFRASEVIAWLENEKQHKIEEVRSGLEEQRGRLAECLTPFELVQPAFRVLPPGQCSNSSEIPVLWIGMSREPFVHRHPNARSIFAVLIKTKPDDLISAQHDALLC